MSHYKPSVYRDISVYTGSQGQYTGSQDHKGKKNG